MSVEIYVMSSNANTLESFWEGRAHSLHTLLTVVVQQCSAGVLSLQAANVFCVACIHFCDFSDTFIILYDGNSYNQN
jgi:hypothetical protein